MVGDWGCGGTTTGAGAATDSSGWGGSITGGAGAGAGTLAWSGTAAGGVGRSTGGGAGSGRDRSGSANSSVLNLSTITSPSACAGARPPRAPALDPPVRSARGRGPAGAVPNQVHGRSGGSGDRWDSPGTVPDGCTRGPPGGVVTAGRSPGGDGPGRRSSYRRASSWRRPGRSRRGPPAPANRCGESLGSAAMSWGMAAKGILVLYWVPRGALSPRPIRGAAAGVEHRVVGQFTAAPPVPRRRSGPGTRGRNRRARPSARRGGGPSPRA